MPNLTPNELPIRIQPGGSHGGGCTNGTCVKAEITDRGVLVTSTIPGNDESVTFTTDEWDAFLVQVKAGSWDHTFTKAPALA